jgi:hypothetical protein
LSDRQFTGKAGKYLMRVRTRNLRWNEINMAELDLKKLIFHFEQSNKADGKSTKTISWYNEMLTNFVDYLKPIDRDTVLGELNITTVREYIIQITYYLISSYQRLQER